MCLILFVPCQMHNASKFAMTSLGKCVEHLSRCKTSTIHFFYSQLVLLGPGFHLYLFQFISQGVPGALMRAALTKILTSCPWKSIWTLIDVPAYFKGFVE